MENIEASNIALKRVTSKGRRYVYLRSSGEAVVKGFTGTDEELEAVLRETLGQSDLSKRRRASVALAKAISSIAQ